MKAEDVSAITLLSHKGFWSYPDTKSLDDDAINEFILMLQKQSFIYFMDDNDFYGRDYGSTEFVIIMITTDLQKTIQLQIHRNNGNGQIFVDAHSNYIYNLSTVYKFSNDTGTLFYDWLLEQ